MAFRVEIEPQAFEDLDEIADWIKAGSSFETAERWFNGMIAAIATLREMPPVVRSLLKRRNSATMFVFSFMGGDIERTRSISTSATKLHQTAS